MEDVVGESNPLARDLDEVLAGTGALWDELRGARLFLTGGTGFFGCWLLETLLWANDKLALDASAVVLTRDAAAFHKKAPHLAGHRAVTLHAGDIRTFTFPEGPFTHVVHAATTSSAPVAPDEMFDTIVDGTRRALQFARVSGAPRFLLTSSGAVYGTQPPDLLNVPEDYVGAPDCTDARNAYGEGKRAAEMLCAIHSSDTLEPVIARCFAVVGPYLPLDAHFAIGNFIRDALAGGPIRIMGDGTPQRSYLYGADLAIWLWTILLRGEPRRPYNVGSDIPLSIADVARLVSAQVGEGKSAVTVSGERRPGERVAQYVPSTVRARAALRLSANVGLASAISRTAEWNAAR